MSSLRLDVSQGAVPPPAAIKSANLVLYGHSFVVGLNAARIGVTDFASRLGNGLDSSVFTYTSIGHSGYRTGGSGQSTTAALWPLAPTDVDPKIVAGKVNILLYMETINSVSFYQSGSPPASQVTANTIADLQAFFLARRAAGWNTASGNLIGTYCMVPELNFPAVYKQSCYDINTWIKTVAIANGYIDFYVDLPADPEYQAIVWAGSDGIHPPDYGHQIIYDMTMPPLLAAYEAAAVNTSKHVWSPALLPRCLFWVGMEAQGKYVFWDGFGKISKLTDRSGWGYDFTAAAALRPTWNRVNASIDASSSCMTTTLPFEMDYSQRVNVFASYSCATTGTVICELGTNATIVTDSWVISNETGGPKIASYGNVGTSSAIASSIVGIKNMLFTIDHSLSSGQGNILIEGTPAAGLVKVDAPNTNVFGNRTMSLFARATGIVPSTMSLRVMVASTKAFTTTDISNLLAYTHAQFG